MRSDYDDAVHRQRQERERAAPIACTEDDLREGETAGEPCPSCGHPKRAHGFGGCEYQYQTAEAPHFILGPVQTCGCEEWDPMCTAIESGEAAKASVTELHK